MSTRSKNTPHKSTAKKSRLRLPADPLDNLEAFDAFVNQARDEAAFVLGDLRRTGFFRPEGF